MCALREEHAGGGAGQAQQSVHGGQADEISEEEQRPAAAVVPRAPETKL